MEEMSPAVAVPLSLGSPMCENAGISNHMEITRLKIVTDTAMLLSDPASLLHADSSSNWDGSCNGIGTEGSKDKSVSPIDNGGVSKMLQKTQNNEIVGDAIMQESDEVLLVRDDRNGINGMELLPLEPTSEISLPIAVQIEGINNGQILAKVISLEERSFERKVSEDNLTTAAQLNEENSSVPTLKASVVALQLPNEKDPVKGGMKSVFELECVPLWGSVSICGQRPEIEDAIMVVPHFMRIPIKMFIGDRVGDGISQTLSHLTSHFFGVYDGHGGSQPNREDEYARIEASGGKVIQWNGHRVFGVLAMSRSIGDRYLKPWIIPTPEVMFLPRAREDECLVLASDGLWDVMTNEEACEVARRRILLWHKKNGTNPLPERGRGVDPAAQAAAEYLSMLALQKGSKDDISVIVIDLKARRKGRQYVS